MKFGFIFANRLVFEVAVDWFSKCCFQIAIFNIENHEDKIIFEVGLAGVTFLLILGYNKILKPNNHE